MQFKDAYTIFSVPSCRCRCIRSQSDPFFMDKEEENNEEVEKPEKEGSLAAVLAENSHLSALLAKASSRSPTDGKGPTPTDGMDEVRHSYVEGATFDDRFAEIEAMGGGM